MTEITAQLLSVATGIDERQIAEINVYKTKIVFKFYEDVKYKSNDKSYSDEILIPDFVNNCKEWAKYSALGKIKGNDFDEVVEKCEKFLKEM